MQMNFQIDNIDTAVWLIVNSPEYISRNIACLVFTFDLCRLTQSKQHQL